MEFVIAFLQVAAPIVVLGYVALFVLTQLVTSILATEKAKASRVVLYIFIAPIVIALALLCLVLLYARIVVFVQDREHDRFNEICKSEAIENISRRQIGIQGLQVDLPKGPLHFSVWLEPKQFHSRGYQFVDIEGKRYFAKDAKGESSDNDKPSAAKVVLKFRSEQSEGTNARPVESTTILTIESLDNVRLAEKKWVYNKQFGTCPFRSIPNHPDATQEVFDFVVAVVPPPRR